MRDKTRRPWKHGQAGAHVVAPHPLELRRTDERGKNTTSVQVFFGFRDPRLIICLIQKI
jgi:hypothetical protein